MTFKYMLIVSPIQCKGTILESLLQRLSQSGPKRAKSALLVLKANILPKLRSTMSIKI